MGGFTFLFQTNWTKKENQFLNKTIFALSLNVFLFYKKKTNVHKSVLFSLFAAFISFSIK